MQLVVQSAGVADRLPVRVPPPKSGLGGFAVGAGGPLAAGRALKEGRRSGNAYTVEALFTHKIACPSVCNASCKASLSLPPQ